MISRSVSLLLLFFLTLVSFSAQTKYDPTVFKTYLSTNRMPKCSLRQQAQMPLSFFTTSDYWDSIPLNERVPANRSYNQSTLVPACQHQMIPSSAMDDYEFQTEKLLSTLGLNIYDGAVHSIASALVGDAASAIDYENTIIGAGKTCQFGDIHGDAPCKGAIDQGQCTDPEQGGACGFCYGLTGSAGDRTLAKENAWTFRMISDYWAIQGTVDARCPSLSLLWTWNDYRPVLGENAWANLIGPLQVAYINYKSVQAIPDNDISITMALNFLGGLPKMVSSLGALFYSPLNNLGWENIDSGFDVSTENNISLLAGLKMLRYILATKGIHPEQLPIIDNLITGILTYVKSAYDPTLGYFRQGGTFDNVTGAWSWHTGDSGFAVDCQTWTLSVLGPQLVDGWFGAGTTIQIWETAKRLGGYNYVFWSGEADGMGFSINSNDQAFSGEWTFGTINMLRIVAAALKNSTMISEASAMRDNISQQLTQQVTINGVQVTGVNYCNKRYWIPFGWWANPIISTASTGWAVMVDSNFNPFHLGGAYNTSY